MGVTGCSRLLQATTRPPLASSVLLLVSRSGCIIADGWQHRVASLPAPCGAAGANTGLIGDLIDEFDIVRGRLRAGRAKDFLSDRIHDDIGRPAIHLIATGKLRRILDVNLDGHVVAFNGLSNFRPG